MIDSRKKALEHFRQEKRKDRDSMEFPAKKVSVMADSEEGLEKGLEKAKEVLESGVLPEMEESMEHSEEDHDSKEYSDEALAMMSREELIDCIKKMRDEEESEDESEEEVY